MGGPHPDWDELWARRLVPLLKGESILILSAGGVGAGWSPSSGRGSRLCRLSAERFHVELGIPWHRPPGPVYLDAGIGEYEANYLNFVSWIFQKCQLSWTCQKIWPQSARRALRKPFKISVNSVISVVRDFLAHLFRHSRFFQKYHSTEGCIKKYPCI